MGVNVTPKRTQHARGGDPGSNQLNKFLCRPIKVCDQDRMMMGVWRLLVLMGMAMPANGGESSCAVGAGPGPASEDSRQQQPACHSVWAGAPSTAHLPGASALVITVQLSSATLSSSLPRLFLSFTSGGCDKLQRLSSRILF